MPQETAAGAPWGRACAARWATPFLAVVLPALWAGLEATRDLGWPYDPDFFRSIAQAQVFADGQWTAEPFYRGEKAWYPPLAQAVVAVVAQATGAPVPLLFARLGPWLNLLGPLALYVLALRAFGRDVALLAVFDYVYLRPAWLLSWASGSYSPWLFSTTFAHGFFLGALALYLQALASGRTTWYALAGCAAGLTVLCHNSPAVLLGVAVGVLLVDRLAARATPRRGLIAGHAVLALAAALTALPNLLVLVGHYGLGFREPGAGPLGLAGAAPRLRPAAALSRPARCWGWPAWPSWPCATGSASRRASCWPGSPRAGWRSRCCARCRCCPRTTCWATSRSPSRSAWGCWGPSCCAAWAPGRPRPAPGATRRPPWSRWRPWPWPGPRTSGGATWRRRGPRPRPCRSVPTSCPRTSGCGPTRAPPTWCWPATSWASRWPARAGAGWWRCRRCGPALRRQPPAPRRPRPHAGGFSTGGGDDALPRAGACPTASRTCLTVRARRDEPSRSPLAGAPSACASRAAACASTRSRAAPG